MPTTPDTSAQLRELAVAIDAYPAQSVDTQAALAWVRDRLGVIAAGSENPICPSCAGLLARGVARPAVSLLN